MSVNIAYDITRDLAVLHDDEWAFGPVFTGDADEKATRFLAWFASGDALDHARTVGIEPRGILGMDGRDPRDYSDGDLSRLYSEWQNVALADDDLADAPQAVNAR